MSEQVQVFLRDQIKPAISFLTEVELFSAIARKVRMGDLSRKNGGRILAKFLSHLNSDLFSLTPVEPNHWQLPRGWLGLFDTSLRTLDALHLAIASAEEYELVTSDQHLIQAAKKLGVKIRTMEAI